MKTLSSCFVGARDVEVVDFDNLFLCGINQERSKEQVHGLGLVQSVSLFHDNFKLTIHSYEVIQSL